MVTVVASSSTLRYSKDLSISSPTPYTWYKAQTVTITSDISGTIRVTYNVGGNTGCYDVSGCVGTEVRRNGVAIYGNYPPEGIGSIDSGPIHATLLTNDILELWIIETDCGTTNPSCTFPVNSNSFRVYYDPSGGAYFTSSPSGAEIWVDGVDQLLTTPNGIPLTAGSHTYRLTLAGYNDATGSFTVSGTATTNVSATLTVATTGNASFTSTPSSASIYLDGSGTSSGITPATITGLSSGSHTYRLTLAGYNDATGSFSVTTGSTTTVPNVNLTPTTGNASFTSNPTGATIWIDGINKGVITPNTITNLSAGGHSFIFKLTGYADATGSFSVTGGSTTTVPTVTFSGSAGITSTPSGARIYLAVSPGTPTDQGVTTPSTFTGLTSASSGATTVWNYRLTLSGYADTTGSFTATAGSTTTLPTITFAPSAVFTTTPSGASIWIDGILQIGVTSSTITGLTAGSHTYKLFLAGYNAITGNFTTIAGQTTTVPTMLLIGTAMAFLSAGD